MSSPGYVECDAEAGGQARGQQITIPGRKSLSTRGAFMRRRNLQLDLLRCVAILGVLVTHLASFRPPNWWWDRLLTQGTWSGVDLFFVISGYLISGLLFSEFQKHGRINFGRFAIRRALKLYPTLYVLVFGVALNRLLVDSTDVTERIVRPLLHDIFFVQSYLRGTYGHFWSLSVEEHFYVLLPLTLYLMIRNAPSGETNPFRRLPSIFLAVCIFSLSARLITGLLIQPYDHHTHLFPTHLRLDSLLFGVLISYWQHFHSEVFRAAINRIRPLLLPSSLVLIAPAFFLPLENFSIYTIGLSLLYLGYGCLILAMLQMPLHAEGFAGRLLWPFSYIGQHSYSIYLFHISIMEFLMQYGLLGDRRGIFLYFASTILGGILLSKFIEFPVLHLRRPNFPGSGG